jgi:integrase
VTKARDEMKDTPVQANQMLFCGRGFWRWCARFSFVEGVNPFEVVPEFDIPDRGHVPWPQPIIDFAIERAWPDLSRMFQLGIMTCQRGSDLIRLGPSHRERTGIWCRPKKTRKKRRSFHIPLDLSDALLLDWWTEQPITFTNTRYKQAVSQHNRDLYFYTPRGVAYTEDSLRSRYHRWLKDTDDGKEFCRLWQAWVVDQIQKYEWDIAAEDTKNPTLHGLRGTGILKRWSQGHGVDQIANDIGMSRQNVEHYMRFKDQMEVAAAGTGRLRLVKT